MRRAISNGATLDAQRRFREFPPAYAGWLLASDLLSFVVAAFAAAWIVHPASNAVDLAHFFFFSSYIFVAFWIAWFYGLGLYRHSLALSIRDEFYHVVAALVLGIAPQFLFFTLVPELSSSRLVLVLAGLLAIIVVGGGRAIAHAARVRRDERSPFRVVVVGEHKDETDAAIAMMALEPGSVVSALVARERKPGDGREWLDEAIRRGANLVVLSSWCFPALAPDVVYAAQRANIEFALLYPSLSTPGVRLRLDRRGGRMLLRVVPHPVTTSRNRLYKRAFDLSATLAILAFAAPVMLAAGLAILVMDGAPVLYRQQRVGRNNVPFSIYKFRTMRPDTVRTGWAVENDPRITKVGAFLRRTSIDELPQFLNVLRGEMSIVGPRPEMVAYAGQFSATLARYDERHAVAPGITGWSQIHMTRVLTPEDAADVLQHDLFYIENWNAMLDLSIVFKTATEFLFHAVA